MRIKLLRLGVIFTLLLFGCTNKSKVKDTCNTKQSPIVDIKLDNISLMKVYKGGIEYEIKEKEKIKDILLTLKSSHIKYIKFGSKDIIKIYDYNHNVLIECLFRDDMYKIKGVVYQTDQIIFK